MTSSRPNSRLSRALTEISHAQSSVDKAISLLGGFTKVNMPKSNKAHFVARKMLESVHLRLIAITGLLTQGEKPEVITEAFIKPIKEDPDNERIAEMISHFPVIKDEHLREVKMDPSHAAPYDKDRDNPLRDSFEQDYDKERDPKC